MTEAQTNLTLRQRQRLQKSDGATASEPKSKRRYLRAILAASLVVLLGVGVAWAWMYFNRGNDPRYLEVLALQAQADKLDGPAAFELYRQIHEKAKDLPDDLKKLVEQRTRHSAEGRFGRFFAMSSKDQLAELDQFIFLLQAKQFKDSLTGQPPASAGTDSGKPGGGPGGAPGGHGGGWGGSDSQKVQHMQKMLANSSPQQRAQFWLGIQMFKARMQQQGVTPPAGGIF